MSAFDVKPRRWWWPPDRKAAKLAQKLVDHLEQDIINQAVVEMVHGTVYHWNDESAPPGSTRQ